MSPPCTGVTWVTSSPAVSSSGRDMPSIYKSGGCRPGSWIGQAGEGPQRYHYLRSSGEVDVEQLLIRGLPAGTKARLDVLARRNGRSREAEVRVILDQALRLEPVSLADLLAMPESGGIEFEPGRLGALGRDVEL